MRLSFFLLLMAVGLRALSQQPSVNWIHGYGGDVDDDIGTKVVRTADSGVIISLGSNSTAASGNIDSFCATSGYKTVFLKFNRSGDSLLWHKCYQWDGDSAYGFMFPKNNGHFVFGGQFGSGSGWGFLLCEEDALGNLIWQKAYSKGNGAILRDVSANEDGGYLLAGQVFHTDTNFSTHHGSWSTSDIGLILTDSMGNKIWSKVIGGSQNEDIFSVIPVANGWYLAGTTYSNDLDLTGNHGGSDAFVIRLDASGNILWHKDLGGSATDGSSGYATRDSKGGCYAAFASNSNDGDNHTHIGGFDYWIMHIDSFGSIVWEQCYGAPAGNEHPKAIATGTDGSIWITGTSGTAGGEVDTLFGSASAWIIHTDSSGSFLGGLVLGGTGDNQGQMICNLTGGNVLTGGLYSDNGAVFSSLPQFGTFPTFDAFLAILDSGRVTSVHDRNAARGLTVYPNPATTAIRIFTDPWKTSMIAIKNIWGQTFYESSNFPDTILTLDVANWARGLYFVSVTGKEGYFAQLLQVQ